MSQLEKFQMHSIIQEIQLLTNHLQSQNRNILKHIEELTRSTPTTYTNISFSTPTQQYQQSSSIKKKTQKLQDETIISRVSKQTVKQSSQRCKSSQSIKQSRVTQKSISINRKKLNPSPFQKRKMKQTQSTISRLKKISQKSLGKIPTAYLLKKKSKIYHFQTHQ